MSVLLGNGNGTFQAAASFEVGDAPSSVAVADFDGDTVPDLVAANLSDDDTGVLLGDGSGGLSPNDASRTSTPRAAGRPDGRTEVEVLLGTA